jgi:hypothetical protein
MRERWEETTEQRERLRKGLQAFGGRFAPPITDPKGGGAGTLAENSPPRSGATLPADIT